MGGHTINTQTASPRAENLQKFRPKQPFIDQFVAGVYTMNMGRCKKNNPGPHANSVKVAQGEKNGFEATVPFVNSQRLLIWC